MIQQPGIRIAMVHGMAFTAMLFAGSSRAEPVTKSRRQTALDSYVAKEDPSYSWKLVDRHEDDDATVLVLDLKSQTWRKTGEVDRPLWQHWLTITVPKGASSTTGLLIISGGDNGKDPPEQPSERARKVAIATRSVVAEVGQVPNEPLEFRNDGRMRKEDDLIARSWIELMKSGDPNWAAQLPMTKSAVRAMDAVEEALEEHGFPAVDSFVVAGGSKRGWTAWLTAAVDPRVVAVAPVVIDVLNVQASMKNHHAAYGFWAQALSDYQQHGLTLLFNNPLAPLLFNLVDPYAYRDRLTMPKCVINATGDQYFTPDSSQFYFDDLAGEKLLYYAPNADHSLEGSNALDTLIAFHASILNDLPRPKVEWTRSADGGWRVTSDPPPKRATAWTAVNEKARDFRVRSIGKAFTSRELEANKNGEYVIEAPAPESGWAAYLVELEFDIGAPAPLHVTTPVRIVPDTLPFADSSTSSPALGGE